MWETEGTLLMRSEEGIGLFPAGAAEDGVAWYFGIVRKVDGVIGQVTNVAPVDVDFGGDCVPEVRMLEEADGSITPERTTYAIVSKYRLKANNR